MGRWAQSRKRGGGGAPDAQLSPPPQPQLAEVVGEIIQASKGLDDTGGSLTLQQSVDEGLNWTDLETTEWEFSQNWGPADFYAPTWLRCTETGNGTTYAATSAPSETLILA